MKPTVLKSGISLGHYLQGFHLYSVLDWLHLKKYVTELPGVSTPQRIEKTQMDYTLSSAGIQTLKTACAKNRKLWGAVIPCSVESHNK